MKRLTLTAFCWIAGAMAVCLATAAVRSGPVGLPTIALGVITAILGTQFCIIGESSVQGGLRTAMIGFVVLLALPLAPVNIFTWLGIFVCVAATVAATTAAGLLWRLNQNERLSSGMPRGT